MPTKQYKIQYRMQTKLKETQEKKSLNALPLPKYKVGDMVISLYTFGYIKYPPIWNSIYKTYVYHVYVESFKNGVISTIALPFNEDELNIAKCAIETNGSISINRS